MQRFWAALGAAGFSFIVPAVAQTDPDLTVDGPFSTSTARDNLRYCDNSLSDQDVINLERIDQLSYEFVPPMGGSGDDTGPDVSITRHLVVELPELNVASVAQALSSLNQDSCETTLRVEGVSVQIPDTHHYKVHFHVAASQRACGVFLGIPYKTDVGDGSADVDISYRIDGTLNIVPEGQPSLTNINTSRNPFFSLLDFIFPIAGLSGEVFSRIIENQLRDSLASARSIFANANQDRFRVFSAGLKSIQLYTAGLDLVNDLSWILDTDPALSGFLVSEVNPPKFSVVQSKVYPALYGKLAYDVRKAEIAYIRDLAKSSPRFYEVQKGDSLWKIAKSTYLDTRIYLYVEDLNNLRGKHLLPGTSVRLPLLYEVCQKVVLQDGLVRPRDSLYGITIRRHAPFHPPVSQLRSHNPNLIYPYEGIH